MANNEVTTTEAELLDLLITDLTAANLTKDELKFFITLVRKFSHMDKSGAE